LHTKHIKVGPMACRIEYGSPSRIARLYTWNGNEVLAQCQQCGKLSDGTPTLSLSISTALDEAAQKRCAARLLAACHEGSTPTGGQQ
jgi:hypothetical protein